MSAPALFGLGLLLAAFLMGASFVLARRLDNFSIVDAFWAANFTPLAWMYATLGAGYPPRRLLVAAMVTLWSLRLAAHLFTRIARAHPVEDGRYLELRRSWAGRVNGRFFLFFQAQGLLNALLSVPFLLACLDRSGPLGVFEVAGVTLFAMALAGEALADRQLAAFKADPGNRGRVCDVGLWRYSRHPNYFFESLVWCAFFLVALSSPWGWATLSCPLLMLFFLFRVTGIPATEAQALRSRGDAYQEYRRRTSAFVPWPRRA